MQYGERRQIVWCLTDKNRRCMLCVSKDSFVSLDATAKIPQLAGALGCQFSATQVKCLHQRCVIAACGSGHYSRSSPLIAPYCSASVSYVRKTGFRRDIESCLARNPARDARSLPAHPHFMRHTRAYYDDDGRTTFAGGDCRGARYGGSDARDFAGDGFSRDTQTARTLRPDSPLRRHRDRCRRSCPYFLAQFASHRSCNALRSRIGNRRVDGTHRTRQTECTTLVGR